MPKLFEYASAQDLFRVVGVTPGRDWQETRKRIQVQVPRQLARRDLHPPTVVKWHRLATLEEQSN